MRVWHARALALRERAAFFTVAGTCHRDVGRFMKHPQITLSVHRSERTSVAMDKGKSRPGGLSYGFLENTDGYGHSSLQMAERGLEKLTKPDARQICLDIFL